MELADTEICIVSQGAVVNMENMRIVYGFRLQTNIEYSTFYSHNVSDSSNCGQQTDSDQYI